VSFKGDLVMSLSGGGGVGDRGSGLGNEARFLAFNPNAEVSVLNLGMGLVFSVERGRSLSGFRGLEGVCCLEEMDHQVREDVSCLGGRPEDMEWGKGKIVGADIECWQRMGRYKGKEYREYKV
jgi:hypothetical protein